MKEFADDNFMFDENGRKFSKWVENIVGKGEIACYKQFLLFPQCFRKTFPPLQYMTSENQGLFGKGLSDRALFVTYDLLDSNQFNPLTTNFRLFQTQRVCRRQFQI